MSEPIPESVPTSQDPRSKRPTKRRALTPLSEHATQIDALFKDPEKELRMPPSSKQRTSANLPPPPEIVANVQGSSAGAGSGEFHVYKASRRREYERIRLMDEEVRKEKADEEFEARREEAKKKDEEKTDKNRKKREKRKAAAKGKKSGTPGPSSEGNQNSRNETFKNGHALKNGSETGDSSNAVDISRHDGDGANDSKEEGGVIIHDED